MFEDPDSPASTTFPRIAIALPGWQLNEQYQETGASFRRIDHSGARDNLGEGGKRGTQREFVVYWEQLGEHVLFDRADLGFKVRWSLRGREKWPALLKVMVSMPTNNVNDPKSLILDFAKEIAAWENRRTTRAWPKRQVASRPAAPPTLLLDTRAVSAASPCRSRGRDGGGRSGPQEIFQRGVAGRNTASTAEPWQLFLFCKPA